MNFPLEGEEIVQNKKKWMRREKEHKYPLERLWILFPIFIYSNIKVEMHTKSMWIYGHSL